MNFGEFSKELHQNVGEEVVKNNIDILVTVGKDAKYIAQTAKALEMHKIYICNANEEAIHILKDIMQENDAVLLKAANGMKFIEIVKAIR